MIGTSDGEQFQDAFDFTVHTLKGVSSHINPDKFDEALQGFPESTKIDDRRNDKPQPARATGTGGQLGFGDLDPITGQIEAGNIDLNKRPVVRNPDGSISTVRSLSFSEGGPEILIPTVHPEGRIMTDDEAIGHYQKTGQHLGKFDTPENASAYAQQLHKDQEKQYGTDLTQPARDLRPIRRSNRSEPSPEDLQRDREISGKIIDTSNNLAEGLAHAIVDPVKSAITLPGDVYAGKVQQDTPEYQDRVFDFMTMFGLRSMRGTHNNFLDTAKQVAQQVTHEAEPIAAEFEPGSVRNVMDKATAGKLEFSEGRSVDPARWDSSTMHSFKNAAGTQGYVILHEKDAGKTLYVDLVSSRPAGMSFEDSMLATHADSAWGLGSAGTRDLLRKLQEKYPKAEYLEGLRISGARNGPLATKETLGHVRIKLPTKKPYDPKTDL